MKEMNNQLTVTDTQELKVFVEKVQLLSQLHGETIDCILEKVLTTFFARTLKPRLKDYPKIYIEKGKAISGYGRRLVIKGKKAWEDGTHGMTDNVSALLIAIDSDYITNNIVKSAATLVETTLNGIFSSGNDNQISRYAQAIYQENFIYMMLQMAVKLIAIDLHNSNIDIENRTLSYMTKMIEKDKNKIVKLFREAYNSSDDIHEVVQEYYQILNKYFDDFLEREHTVTGEEMIEIGKEQLLVETIGENNILVYLGYLVGEIQENLNYTKPMFKEEKAITIK